MSNRNPDLLRELYLGPWKTFSSRRGELAKRAPKDETAALRTAKKPSISAWATSRVLDQGEASDLLERGRKARAALASVFRGESAATLRQAMEAVEAAIRDATERAVHTASEETGRGIGDAVEKRIADNFRALALGETADILARGWLDEDLPLPGLETLTFAGSRPTRAVAPSRPNRAQSHRQRAASRPTQETRQREERVREEKREARRLAAAAQREAEREEARAEAARVRDERVRARARIRELERVAKDEERLARAAERAASEARARATDAARELARARARLERL